MARVVVTREPEWDDRERDKMLLLAQYELEICECGLHTSIADEDPDLQMTVRRCPVCAGLAQQYRRIQASDEAELKALGKTAPPEVERPGDGRFFGLRPRLSPELTRLLSERYAAANRSSSQSLS